jgi:PAS domain S-box-containing protein
MNESAGRDARRWQLREAVETLHAIRYGAVDAFVVQEGDGHRVYALAAADLPYSALVEQMQQGTAMLNVHGDVIYCNPALARMVDRTRENVIGLPLSHFVEPDEQAMFQKLLQEAQSGASQGEMNLRRADGSPVPVNLSFGTLSPDKSTIAVLITDLTAQRQQAALIMRLQQLQDEERRRLAREMHDSVGQLLVAIAMNIANVAKEAHKLTPETARLVAENAVLIEQINREIRTVSHLLHPPLLDEVGLTSALQWYVDGFAARSKISATLEMPQNFERLPQAMEITIFRAVQEALTNVHRHSGSPSCVVRLARDQNRVRLEIRDSGHGIPPGKLEELRSSAGVGLRGLQERFRHLGGTLEITSGAGGTVVSASLPLPRTSEDDAVA